MKPRRLNEGVLPRVPGLQKNLTESANGSADVVVVAISEKIRLIGEINEDIDEHDGWPGAFVTNGGSG
jgi:hypothetical protein